MNCPNPACGPGKSGDDMMQVLTPLPKEQTIWLCPYCDCVVLIPRPRNNPNNLPYTFTGLDPGNTAGPKTTTMGSGAGQGSDPNLSMKVAVVP